MSSNPNMTLSAPGYGKPNKTEQTLKAKRENKVTIVLLEALCPIAISHYTTLYHLTGMLTAL